ncbi:uncharacterized protein DUF2550 [Rhodococcus sp. OK302]|nr:uncharacterized protein DUF2550 [Rhodococcus sp. OK302]
MTFGMIVLIILGVLLAVLVAAFLYRVVKLRHGGTPALLRGLPAVGDSGWRHGIIRYGESAFVFFKLSSLRPGPDSRIDRQGIEVESRRSRSGTEFDIMSDDIVVLRVRDGASRYEIALDSGALTAFLSWVESRPDGRARRRRTA